MPIYVDGDACPVKEEVYRVARRHVVKVFVVANATMRVAITTDIPLAGRCLEKGARVLGPKGKAFTEDDIGNALATRALMEMLRQGGTFTGGPAAFAKEDRSRFLAKLDETLHAIKRGKKRS